LFADDSLLFFKADAEQASCIKNIMQLYCRCNDQLINPQKYSVLFGTLFSSEAKNSVRGVLQIEKEAFDEKYLGLPTTEGKMNKDKFQPVKERFGKRLAD